MKLPALKFVPVTNDGDTSARAPPAYDALRMAFVKGTKANTSHVTLRLVQCEQAVTWENPIE